MWRKAALVCRAGIAVGLFAAGFLSGQTLTPLGVTASQNIGSGNQATTRIGPSGDLYLVGGPGQYSWSTVTKSYGNTAGQTVTYVSRVSVTGTTVFTTALGGAFVAGITIDTSGNIFLNGTASSSGFYTSPGAYRTAALSSNSGFVCKLSGTDGAVLYCTYMDYTTSANGGGVDEAGEFIAVAGATAFNGAPPPTTTGALHLGSGHIYVAKLNPAGSAFTYVAEFGGSGFDTPEFEAVDAAGNIYIAGQTSSGDFPTTPGAPVSSSGASVTVPVFSFLTKVSIDGSTLDYSTLGQANEQPEGLSLDSAGEAQILYWNESLQVGARRYSADGSTVLFDAFTGISINSPSLLGIPLITIDSGGNTSVFLVVNSITTPLVNPTQTCQFPPIGSGYQGGFTDSGFMVRLDPSGKVQQSTYLEGAGAPLFEDVAVQPSGSLTVAAWTDPPPELQVLTIAPSATVSLACIGSSASLVDAPLVAGEIVSLFGVGIGPAEPVVAVPAPIFPGGSPLEFDWGSAGYQYPTALGATSVTFDGVAAPLLYVSGSQINAVVPFAAKNPTHVCVTYFFNARGCMDAPIAFAAPAIFTIPQVSQNLPYAAAVNQDGTINSESNPAPRGSIISLFATGLGPLSSTPVDGDTVILPLLTQSLNVMVESSNSLYDDPLPELSAPAWAGQAPFEIAGLSQVNAVVPGYGNQIGLQVTQTGAGGPAVSSLTVQIWVK